MPTPMESPTSVIFDDHCGGRRILNSSTLMSPPKNDDTAFDSDSFFGDRPNVRNSNLKLHPSEMNRYFRDRNSPNSSNLSQLSAQQQQIQSQFLHLDASNDLEGKCNFGDNVGVPKSMDLNTKRENSLRNSSPFCIENTFDNDNQHEISSTTLNTIDDSFQERHNDNPISAFDASFNSVGPSSSSAAPTTPAEKRASMTSTTSMSTTGNSAPAAKEKQKNDKAVEVLHNEKVIARFRTQTECAKYLRATPEAISYHCSKGGGVCNGLVIRPAREIREGPLNESGCSLMGDSSPTKFGLFEGAEENRPKVRPQLAPEAVAILKEWLLSPEHVDNPYPNQRESEMLLRKTGLDKSQLKHWFNNARKRILKPLLKKGELLSAAAAMSQADYNKRRRVEDSFNTGGMMMMNGMGGMMHGRCSMTGGMRAMSASGHGYSMNNSDSDFNNSMPNLMGRGTSPSFFDRCHSSDTAVLQREQRLFRNRESMSFKQEMNQMQSMMGFVDMDNSSNNMGGMMNNLNSRNNFDGDTCRSSSMLGFSDRSQGQMDFNNNFDSMNGINDRPIRGQMDRSLMDFEGRSNSMGVGSKNDRFMGFNDRSLSEMGSSMSFNNDRNLDCRDRSLSMGYGNDRNGMGNSGDRFPNSSMYTSQSQVNECQGSFNNGNNMDSSFNSMGNSFNSSSGMMDCGMNGQEDSCDFYSRKVSQQDSFQSNSNNCSLNNGPIGNNSSSGQDMNNESMPEMLRSNAVFKQQVAAMAMNEANTAFKEMEEAYMRAKEMANQVQLNSSRWDANPEDDPKVVELNAIAKKCHSVAMFKLKVSQRANEEAANAYKKFQIASGGMDLNDGHF